jgi:hypothetical protein
LATKDVFSNYAIAPSGRRVLGLEVRSCCRDQRDAQRPEKIMAGELNRQVKGEAIRTFRDDAADTIAGDPVGLGPSLRVSSRRFPSGCALLYCITSEL